MTTPILGPFSPPAPLTIQFPEQWLLIWCPKSDPAGPIFPSTTYLSLQEAQASGERDGYPYIIHHIPATFWTRPTAPNPNPNP